MTKDVLFRDSFDSPDYSGHRTLVYDWDGRLIRDFERGETNVPKGWHAVCCKQGAPSGGRVPWDDDNQEGYAEPETRYADHENPNRFRSPPRGILLFTFHRIHDCCLMRHIKIEPGKYARVSLQAWAHAWSNHADPHRLDEYPQPNKPKWSEGAGFDAIAIPEGETDDDKLKNFTFRVGVKFQSDGQLDENPYDGQVVWSKGMHIYNAFAELPDVTADVPDDADTVTIYLRSNTLWRYRHSDAYWDDVELVGVLEGDAPPTEPSEEGETEPTETEPTPPSVTVPATDTGWVPTTGTKVGIHGLRPGTSVPFMKRLAANGARPAAVVMTEDFGVLLDAKKIDSSIVTFARVHHNNEDCRGVHDESLSMTQYARTIMQPTLDKVKLFKEKNLLHTVDCWLVCNEPLGGGVVTRAYVRLAELMQECMLLANENNIKIGIFGFNLGTPEWADMVEMVETGVFGMAAEHGHVVSLHDGTLHCSAKINAHVGERLPGAPVTLEDGGLVAGRWKYLKFAIQQAGQPMPMILVSEWYPGCYANDGVPAETVVEERFRWYDGFVRNDPHVIAFTPFTHGAHSQWVPQECSWFEDPLERYLVSVKDEPNAGVKAPPAVDVGTPVSSGVGAPAHPSGRGRPRVQFNKTYILLHPERTAAWANAVADATWNSFGYSVGKGADEAGVGDLDVRRIITVNPDEWGAGEDHRGLLGFFERYYPGVDARQAIVPDVAALRLLLETTTVENLPALRPFQAATAAAPAQTTGRGQPREQFTKTYILFHPQRKAAWAKAAIHATWNSLGYTVGKGADEAGVGDLDVRRIIAVNPDEWGAGEDDRGLLGFFERYYPGVDARQAIVPDVAALRQLLETTAFENLPALKPFQAVTTTVTIATTSGMAGRFGINLNPEPPSPQHHPHRVPAVDELRGVGWVRLVFLDHDRPDLTRDESFAHYGSIVDRYRAAGIKTLLILNWESFGGAGLWTSGDLSEASAAFGNYVREVAQHFRGRVAAYEIWNEGDAPVGSPVSVHLDPEEYGPVLLAAGRAIKEVDPEALVVFGGLLGGAHANVDYVRRTREHMQGEWPVDAVGVHPYGQYPADDIADLPLTKHGNLRDYLHVVTQGLPGIPIWITEIGVPLGGEVQPRADDSSFHWEEIAAYLKAVYAEVGQGFGQQVPAVFWFAWSNKMEGSGIVDTHDNPRGPIHRAFFETVRGIA